MKGGQKRSNFGPQLSARKLRNEFFGVLGYFIRKFGYEPAPFVLALVLTPLLENALRQSLILSAGSFKIFLTHPISGGCLLIDAVLLLGGIPLLEQEARKDPNRRRGAYLNPLREKRKKV